VLGVPLAKIMTGEHTEKFVIDDLCLHFANATDAYNHTNVTLYKYRAEQDDDENVYSVFSLHTYPIFKRSFPMCSSSINASRSHSPSNIVINSVVAEPILPTLKLPNDNLPITEDKDALEKVLNPNPKTQLRTISSSETIEIPAKTIEDDCFPVIESPASQAMTGRPTTARFVNTLIE